MDKDGVGTAVPFNLILIRQIVDVFQLIWPKLCLCPAHTGPDGRGAPTVILKAAQQIQFVITLYHWAVQVTDNVDTLARVRPHVSDVAQTDNLVNANLSDADLSEAVVGEITMRRTNLSRARLTGTYFDTVDLSEAILDETSFDAAHIIDCEFPETTQE